MFGTLTRGIGQCVAIVTGCVALTALGCGGGSPGATDPAPGGPPQPTEMQATPAAPIGPGSSPRQVRSDDPGDPGSAAGDRPDQWQPTTAPLTPRREDPRAPQTGGSPGASSEPQAPPPPAGSQGESREPGPCTSDDDCAGLAAGTCQTATCGPDGSCVVSYAPDGTPCDAADPCDVATCVSGACVAQPRPCDDGNPCTDDGCDETTGTCVHEANSAPCDDGDPCTQGDTCAEGECVPGDASGPGCEPEECPQGTCPASSDPECWADADCDDGIPCTADTCDAAGTCEHTPDDGACEGPGASCLVATCEPAQGGCVVGNAPDGTPCEDGAACMEDRHCQSGSCTGGHPGNCDDGNVCTQDSCGPMGCEHAPLNGVLCDDGDPCTGSDHCEDGTCTGGIAVGGAGCTETVPFCEVWGEAGDTVSCPVNIARASEDDPPAAGLQFGVSFDATSLVLDNFYDQVCFGSAGCFDVPLAGANGMAMDTGHVLVLAPMSLDNWNAAPCDGDADCPAGSTCASGRCQGTGGYGAVLVLDLTGSGAPLSDAWIDAQGKLQGDPLAFEVRFKLLHAASADSPVTVEVGDAAATTATSENLAVDVEGDLLITSKP